MRNMIMSAAITLRIGLALVAAMLPASATNAAEGERIALVGGTVIPVTDDGPIANATILIDNGKIVAVGPSRKHATPDGYRVIDATGKWITPGLIDTNAHLVLTTIPEFFVKYEDRLDDIALQSAQVALKYGLTTIGDTWGPVDVLLSVRDRINRGEAIGTRVLVGGNIIGTGGPFTPYFMTGWDHRGNDIRYGGWVHPDIQRRINAKWEAGVGPELLGMTPPEVRQALRSYIARGVDFIKIGVSGHSLGAVEPLTFSSEALEAIRDEARRARIPFSTHTFSVPSVKAAMDIGTPLLMHPNVMSTPYASASPEQKAAIRGFAARAAREGVYAGLMSIPNKEQIDIVSRWNAADHPGASAVNAIMSERKLYLNDAYYRRSVEGLKIWLDAGVKYTIATDAGPEAADLGPTIWLRLGRAHFERMEAFQQLGQSPREVLIAATRNGAAAYGLADRLGTIENGKIADLLILTADPLADIRNLRKIDMVIKDGRVVDRQSLPSVKVLDSDPEAQWPF